jgi:hypothetical protein
MRHISTETMSSRRVLDGYNDSGRDRRRTARVEFFEKCLPATLSELGFQKWSRGCAAEWGEGVSIPALIGLRDELDETLHRIRAGRNIQTPIITCRRCGMTGHAAEPRVSVRALMLALARFEIASRDQTRVLEKEWAAYREQHRLDIEGRALMAGPRSCSH